jgi:hypothetical protein
MIKVELLRAEWDVALRAIQSTPTQDLNTAQQLMELIQKISSQLVVKEEDGKSKS